MTGAARKLAEIDNGDVRRAYKRWAPVYDATFGKFVEAGVKQATARANQLHGRLLEVGVGTGLALPHYKPSLQGDRRRSLARHAEAGARAHRQGAGPPCRGAH